MIRFHSAAAAAAIAAGAALIFAAWPASSGLGDCQQATTAAATVVDTSPVPLPDGWTVTTECGRHDDGHLGVANFRTRTVTLWPQAHPDVEALSWTWLHELGHAYDHEHASDWDRRWWRLHRGHDEHRPWLSGGVWDARPGEDLAEAFPACLLEGGTPLIRDFTPPDDAACGLVADLIGGGQP